MNSSILDLESAMMQRERPAAVLVIAILQFVGGGLGLAQDLLGAGMQAMGGNAALAKAFTPPSPRGTPVPEPIDADVFLKEQVPHYPVYLWSHFGLDTLLSALMIISGVGLLKMKRWGRQLAFVYAAYSILLRLVVVVYSFLFIVPATVALMEAQQQQSIAQMSPQQAQAAQQVLHTVKTVTGVAVYVGVLIQLAMMIYPVVVVILLSRKSVAAAFAAAEVEQPAPACE